MKLRWAAARRPALCIFANSRLPPHAQPTLQAGVRGQGHVGAVCGPGLPYTGLQPGWVCSAALHQAEVPAAHRQHSQEAGMTAACNTQPVTAPTLSHSLHSIALIRPVPSRHLVGRVIKFHRRKQRPGHHNALLCPAAATKCCNSPVATSKFGHRSLVSCRQLLLCHRQCLGQLVAVLARLVQLQVQAPHLSHVSCSQT